MTTNTILITDVGDTTSSVVNNFMCLAGGDDNLLTTETQAQTTLRDAGTLSHLLAEVNANGGTTDPTVKLRKGAANVNQTLTLTHGTTGAFEDTLNTDTVTAGDKFNTNFITTSGVSITLSTIALLFAATTDTVSKPHNVHNFAYSAASTTAFTLVGAKETASQTTETTQKYRQRRTGTMKMLMGNVITNTRAQASTIKSRLNGVDGALTKSITGSTTGIFEDTANTDTISAITDDYDIAIVTGTSTGNLAFRPVAVSFINTSNYGVIAGGSSAGIAQAVNITRWYKYGSFNTARTAEDPRSQVKVRDTFTLSDLTVFVSANTVTADSPMTSRKNSGAGSLTATIVNATTGVFTDSTNQESDVAADVINFQITTGATGTSLTFMQSSVYTQQSAVVATSAPAVLPAMFMHYLGLPLHQEVLLGPVMNKSPMTLP